jgi:hypothetical protein
LVALQLERCIGKKQNETEKDVPDRAGFVQPEVIFSPRRTYQKGGRKAAA